MFLSFDISGPHLARSAYDLLFLSPTDHAHALQLEAKLWPALKPLFTAKEIPIEASALCLTPDDWTCCEPVGIPAISSSSCRADSRWSSSSWKSWICWWVLPQPLRLRQQPVNRWRLSFWRRVSIWSPPNMQWMSDPESKSASWLIASHIQCEWCEFCPLKHGWLPKVQTPAMCWCEAVLLPFLLRCLELQEPTILNEAGFLQLNGGNLQETIICDSKQRHGAGRLRCCGEWMRDIIWYHDISWLHGLPSGNLT